MSRESEMRRCAILTAQAQSARAAEERRQRLVDAGPSWPPLCPSCNWHMDRMRCKSCGYELLADAAADVYHATAPSRLRANLAVLEDDTDSESR